VRDHHSPETTITKGLEQTAGYADKCDPEEAHLVVIDPKRRNWDEKVYVEERSYKGRTITVWGM